MVVEDIYIKNFKKFFNDSGNNDRSGIHISDLTSNCFRKMYLIQKIKQFNLNSEFDLKSMNIIYLGQKYHEIPVSNVCINERFSLIENDISEYVYVYNEESKCNKLYDRDGNYLGIYGHEYPITWYGVVGSVDDIVIKDNEIIIVDKKTTSKIPNYIYPNYKKQLEYYAVCLSKMHPNEEFKKGAILYINNYMKHRFQLGSIYTDINVDEATEEFVNKVDKIKEYLEADIIPKADKNSWDCKYCKFKSLCRMIGLCNCSWSDDLINEVE